MTPTETNINSSQRGSIKLRTMTNLDRTVLAVITFSFLAVRQSSGECIVLVTMEHTDSHYQRYSKLYAGILEYYAQMHAGPYV